MDGTFFGAIPELGNRRVPPVHIIVNNGRVTLVGVVLNHSQRVRAENAARGLFGVFDVENLLEVESS